MNKSENKYWGPIYVTLNGKNYKGSATGFVYSINGNSERELNKSRQLYKEVWSEILRVKASKA